MNCVALIPARMGATRFPAKLMEKIGGVSVIRRTWEQVVGTSLFDQVWVVTDSDELAAEVEAAGGRVLRSLRDHESGTDRIAEFADSLDADLIVNVQGDEPFISKPPLAQLLERFNGEFGASIQVASLARILKDPSELKSPHVVKLVLDKSGRALYFSRAPIPYTRDGGMETSSYGHIGVYAFRPEALRAFTQWSPGVLESAEKIECLRFLEHGVPIYMSIVDYQGFGIDTPADLEKARDWWTRKMRRGGLDP